MMALGESSTKATNDEDDEDEDEDEEEDTTDDGIVSDIKRVLSGSIQKKPTKKKKKHQQQKAKVRVKALAARGRTKAAATSDMKGCRLVRNKVKIPQDGVPPATSIVSEANMVVMGNSIQSRVCTLRGIVEFTALSKGNVVAQIDPNLRDPFLKTPLCYPIAAMLFSAGVVENNSTAITKTIAVRIEPHGAIRVVGGDAATASKNVRVRLDGITYTPFMPFNTQPSSGCGPSCFPPSHQDDQQKGKQKMGVSGCLKYCTPPAYKRAANGELRPLDCQCDMLKRLECFVREQDPRLRCGQFKQLLAMRTLSGKSRSKCLRACGQQLSLL
jgi:hypothetical protein